MKSVLIASLAVTLAVLSAACATAAPRLVETTVNLREGPGTNAAILGKVPGGSSVEVTVCTGEWCHVSFQGKSGYVIATSLSNGVGGNSQAGAPRGGPPPGYARAPQGAPPPGYAGAPQGGPPPGYAGQPPAYPYPYPAAYPYPYGYGPYYYGYGPYWGWRRRWYW
jgi:hypothetical protein